MPPVLAADAVILAQLWLILRIAPTPTWTLNAVQGRGPRLCLFSIPRLAPDARYLGSIIKQGIVKLADTQNCATSTFGIAILNVLHLLQA